MGGYVEAAVSLPVGSAATISLTLAGFPLTVTGSVAHANPGSGFGVQFDTLPAGTRRILEEFLSQPDEFP